jgi:uncharacterized SAM-binding protein YcdF (DUF218 family)
VIRRFLAFVVLAWAIGFVTFAVTLPGPLAGVKTDAVIVPTGARGRIGRGLEVLGAGHARQMLVTGVDREVKSREFAAEYGVDAARMRCCITLDYSALDTRGNARAAAEWVRANRFRSVRLVTSDWHMRRTAVEFRSDLPADVALVEDAVTSQPSFRILLFEYDKLLVGTLTGYWRTMVELK